MRIPLETQLKRLRSSSLMDGDWYRREYPDVVQLGIDPAEHYLRVGAALMRDPSAHFSTRHYVELYPDVAASTLNPLYHYEVYGRKEMRLCRAAGMASRPVKLVPVDGAHPEHKPLRRYPGCLPKLVGRPTVLVCAHTSGKQLFGGERSLLDLVEGFGQLAFNVVVATPLGSDENYVEELQKRSLDTLEFAYGWWRRHSLDESAVATFARLIHEYAVDAVHANTIMLREPLVAARRMAVPAVVHVRELIMHDAALSARIGLPPETIVDEVVAAADHIIANSAATGRCFEKSGVTHLLPNTVDVAEFDIPQRNASSEPRIGLISSNLPKKGVYEFVEIARILAAEVPHAKFVLIGPETEHTAMLRRQQASGAVPSNVVFSGYSESPVSAMHDVDIVLNLSHFQESFGRTVLEAMAARRATVVYDWGALPELVDDGVTGHVVPFGDVERCARQLAELCRDGGRVRAMGEAGRRRAVANYGKEHYAERLGAAYTEILRTGSQLGTNAPRMVLPARSPAIDRGSGPSLRIAYFLWHFPVPSETFVLNELRILVEQGHEVQVFCKQSPYPDFVPDFPLRWRTVSCAADLAQALVECGITMVHSHFTYPTVTEMVWPACVQAEVPFTFIAHAQDIFRYANDEKNRIGEIAGSKYCKKVLVPSRFHREYVVERGVPEAKVAINPNGVDPLLYRPGRLDGRARRARRSVCAVHRFTAKKGLVDLIRAGSLLAAEDIEIHLYGYGELEAEYRRIIEDEGRGNVHLHGPLEGRAALLEVFRQHDLFACPSVRAPDGDMDGIPTVLMEAMASGLPVLTTAISGIPDLVQHDVSGFVCEADASSLATGIRRFYALEEAQVQAVIEEGARVVEQDYDVARLTAALVRLWRDETLDIMIVSWNNLPQLREVIRRLYAFTEAPFHLIVCDNGSKSDVNAYLCELYSAADNLTVVLNRENAMVGPGTNVCLEHGASSYAVYVCGKEGFVLDHGWERPLIDYMDANPQVGLGGTLCHSPSYLYGRQYSEGIGLFSEFRNPGFAADNPDREFVHVQGGFFIMRRAMYDRIGGFSEAVAHNYTDVEYSYYVESEGWSLGAPPGLLALYNKTRPGIFTRVDESIAAIHPPTLDDLDLLDGIAHRKVDYCNVCGWHGAGAMGGDDRRCPGCDSRPADRTLYRFLAESKLTYRRLPAVGIGVGPALAQFWQQQFQGGLMEPSAFHDELAQKGRLEYRAGGMEFFHADLVQADAMQIHRALVEASRLLSRDGVLLLRVDEGAAAGRHLIEAEAARGFSLIRRIRYASAVSHYDWYPLVFLRRAGK